MAEDPANKRSGPRSRCLREGKIVFANGTLVVDCMIDNVSDAGAHLRVNGSLPIPRDILLVEPARGLVQRAEVVRRTVKGIGVRFAGLYEDREASAAYLRKFKR